MAAGRGEEAGLHRGPLRDPGPSGRLCRTMPPRGREDAAHLRPLRRPAARAAGRMALPALRAGHPEPGDLRPGRHGRQGPALHLSQGHRVHHRRRRQTAAEREARLRGRGGAGQHELRALRRRAPQAAESRLHRALGRRKVREGPAGHLLRPPRPGVHAARFDRPEFRCPLRHLRRGCRKSCECAYERYCVP